MEYNSKEVAAIEITSEQADQAQAREIDELQLVFAGGGNVTVIIG